MESINLPPAIHFKSLFMITHAHTHTSLSVKRVTVNAILYIENDLLFEEEITGEESTLGI